MSTLRNLAVGIHEVTINRAELDGYGRASIMHSPPVRGFKSVQWTAAPGEPRHIQYMKTLFGVPPAPLTEEHLKSLVGTVIEVEVREGRLGYVNIVRVLRVVS